MLPCYDWHDAIFGALPTRTNTSEGGGRPESLALVHTGLFLRLQLVWSPLDHLIRFGQNAVSRRFEFQADEFAAKLNYPAALKRGLIKLQEANLAGTYVRSLQGDVDQLEMSVR